MPIPIHAQRLIARQLQAIRNDPEHRLRPIDRLIIYESFGASIDLSGDIYTHLLKTGQLVWPYGQRSYAHLAILTAHHVLPIWEQAIPVLRDRDETIPVELSQQMLAIAERVLRGTIDPAEANGLLSTQFHTDVWLLNQETTFEVWYACSACYHALSMVLGRKPFQLPNVDPSLTDEMLNGTTADVAAAAVKAYTAINSDELDVGWSKETVPSAIRFDVKKRQDFWEWWLTEAIPAAWELAAEPHDAG